MIAGDLQRFTLPPDRPSTVPEHGAQGLALIGLLLALSPAAVLVLGVPALGLLGFVLAGLVAGTAGIFAIFFGYIAKQKRSTYGSIAIFLDIVDAAIGLPIIISAIN